MTVTIDQFDNVRVIADWVKNLYSKVSHKNGVGYYDKHIRKIAGACAELHHKYNKLGLGDLMIVSLLHDSGEDFNVDFANQTMRQQKALQLLTRQRKNGKHTITYFDYIRIMCEEESYPGYLARFVKLVDLAHNMSDLEESSLKDKYRFAENYIRSRTNPSLYPSRKEIVEALR